MSSSSSQSLPPVLCGPLLRHTASDRLVLWLVGSADLQLRLRLFQGASNDPVMDEWLQDAQVRRFPVGSHAWVHLIDVSLPEPLPADVTIGYDLGVIPTSDPDAAECWIADWAPHLCMPGADRPDFVIRSRADRLLHGSCRRPHSDSADGLVRVEQIIADQRTTPAERPAMLLMTGDQIYADDVAGPMLVAIHSLIERLGLVEESLTGSEVSGSRELRQNRHTYYHRERLLPDSRSNEALLEKFFGGVRKPVFTSAHAHNHLISFSEVMAMYLLVWSPVCWNLIDCPPPELSADNESAFRREQAALDGFVDGLPAAARAMAHVPCYMIFDDHDVTDDWNLSALWEATTYEHPFSRRIVGNALMAYLLCQGWGNNPDAFDDLMSALQGLLETARDDATLERSQQDQLIDQLLRFDHWHYTLDTSPRVVVMDTRTHRWRSEVNRARPSGLLDWEALTDFQQAIMDQRSVIVVSAAPIFGVKLIEVIQSVFTFFGKPLVVDAENWMAHRGAANVLLNIFGHSRTPENFVILSGDVHYSFVYNVRLRQRPDRPRIWQITSSGIKNEFPHALMEWLDRLNRWLYAPWSPLNWFTKRRRMRVTPWPPEGRDAGERLWNHAGIGWLELDDNGAPLNIEQCNSDEGGTRFIPPGADHH